MKKILAIMLLCTPTLSFADYLDVIEFKLNDGCSFEKYMEIVKDFNKWGAQYGYQAEILMPLQSPNLASMYWVGRTKDAATFGRAWDIWRNALSDANSTPAKLWARFQQCETNLTRLGYDTY